MDEDIRFGPIQFLASTTATVVHRFKVPYKCTFRGLSAIISGNLGASETVTVANETDTKTLGVGTFGATPAAGDEATWVADTTNGNYVNETDEILTFTLSQITAVGFVDAMFELDPKARVP